MGSSLFGLRVFASSRGPSSLPVFRTSIWPAMAIHAVGCPYWKSKERLESATIEGQRPGHPSAQGRALGNVGESIPALQGRSICTLESGAAGVVIGAGVAREDTKTRRREEEGDLGKIQWVRLFSGLRVFAASRDPSSLSDSCRGDPFARRRWPRRVLLSEQRWHGRFCQQSMGPPIEFSRFASANP